MGHDTTYGAVELVDGLAAGGVADDQPLPFPENSDGLARGAPLVGEVGEGGARPCEASRGGSDRTRQVRSLATTRSSSRRMARSQRAQAITTCDLAP